MTSTQSPSQADENNETSARLGAKPTAVAAGRRKQLRDGGITPKSVQTLASNLFAEDLHARTVLSLSTGIVGVLHAVSLAVHAIGRGLAVATGKNSKHTTKQLDRLLSNGLFHVDRLFKSWAQYVVGARKEIVVALDWTDFDDDDQTTLCLYLVTGHGRATPLVWHTTYKSELEGQRNRIEDETIECHFASFTPALLHSALPDDIRVTLLADRGFGDQQRYKHLALLGWDYVIRFREGIVVTDTKGTARPARDWLPKSGRATLLKNARVTDDKTEVPAVVVVHDKRMKDAWCLATSRSDLGASGAVSLYGRRFSIEETFRDTKDLHFGMGLKATHIGDSRRRDRLLFLAAIAHALLTLLGAAGERAGLDRLLKTNTVKTRTLSLYRQGSFWYDAIPNMPEERLTILISVYDQILREQPVFCEIFGLI
jgi:hypothetical protein